MKLNDTSTRNATEKELLKAGGSHSFLQKGILKNQTSIGSKLNSARSNERSNQHLVDQSRNLANFYTQSSQRKTLEEEKNKESPPMQAFKLSDG